MQSKQHTTFIFENQITTFFFVNQITSDFSKSREISPNLVRFYQILWDFTKSQPSGISPNLVRCRNLATFNQILLISPNLVRFSQVWPDSTKSRETRLKRFWEISRDLTECRGFPQISWDFTNSHQIPPNLARFHQLLQDFTKSRQIWPSQDFTKSREISPDLVPSKTTKSNILSLPVVVLHGNGSCKMWIYEWIIWKHKFNYEFDEQSLQKCNQVFLDEFWKI